MPPLQASLGWRPDTKDMKELAPHSFVFRAVRDSNTRNFSTTHIAWQSACRPSNKSKLAILRRITENRKHSYYDSCVFPWRVVACVPNSGGLSQPNLGRRAISKFGKSRGRSWDSVLIGMKLSKRVDIKNIQHPWLGSTDVSCLCAIPYQHVQIPFFHAAAATATTTTAPIKLSSHTRLCRKGRHRS